MESGFIFFREIEENMKLENYTKPIVWTGDLEDDCFAEWNGLYAHAEQMSSGNWFCCVFDKKNGEKAYDADYVLHTMRDDIHPVDGESARKLAEMAMKCYLFDKMLPQKK